MVMQIVQIIFALLSPKCLDVFTEMSTLQWNYLHSEMPGDSTNICLHSGDISRPQ